jgi:hypothetical protein
MTEKGEFKPYYPKKSAKPKRVGSLNSLAQVLPGVCDNLQLDKKINEMAFLALWPRQVEGICGKVAAENTRAFKLRKQGDKTVLMVKVTHATLASELGFQVTSIMEALNRFQPQTGIFADQIQLIVGSL